jgi:hypothetical protein
MAAERVHARVSTGHEQYMTPPLFKLLVYLLPLTPRSYGLGLQDMLGPSSFISHFFKKSLNEDIRALTMSFNSYFSCECLRDTSSR